MSEEIGVDDIDEDYAEAVQLAYAATNAFSTAKGKGKGKDKGGKGKSGGKLVKSNLTIADRKAKTPGVEKQKSLFALRRRRPLGRGRGMQI